MAGLVRNRLLELNAILAALGDREPIGHREMEEIIEEYVDYGERLRPYVANVGQRLAEAVERGEKILFEGAQGALLDIDHGTYPYVTSSNTVASNAATGVGLGPDALHNVVGIMKAYTTRVGRGPFPTELSDELGDRLREVGREFGATTGRPRRCGWLDLVALRYAVRVSGIKQLVITKLDVLAGIPKLKLCTTYQLDGERLTTFPDNAHDVVRVTPIYEEMDGFDAIGSVRSMDDLPQSARTYLDRIAEELACKLALVSVGPGRGEDIELVDPFR